MANSLPKSKSGFVESLFVRINNRLLPYQIGLEGVDRFSALEQFPAKEQERRHEYHEVKCEEVVDCPAPW
jgi:hypothetical protein